LDEDYLRYLARALEDRRLVLTTLGEHAEAVPLQQDTVSVLRQTVHPKWLVAENIFVWSKRNWVFSDEINFRFMPNLTRALISLSRVLSATGRGDEALAAHEEGWAYYVTVLAEGPWMNHWNDPDFKSEFAGVLGDLGNRRAATGDFEGAIQATRDSLVYWGEAIQSGENSHWNLALAHSNLGSLLARSHRFREAEPHLEEAVARYRALLPSERESGNYAQALVNLGKLLRDTGRAKETAPFLDEAASYQSLQ
jgi:tetratricopeptide (TPR) repeat protein